MMCRHFNQLPLQKAIEVTTTAAVFKWEHITAVANYNFLCAYSSAGPHTCQITGEKNRKMYIAWRLVMHQYWWKYWYWPFLLTSVSYGLTGCRYEPIKMKKPVERVRESHKKDSLKPYMMIGQLQMQWFSASSITELTSSGATGVMSVL